MGLISGKFICESNEEFWNKVSKIWDYENNNKNWIEYTKGNNKDKIYIKCEKHGSYPITPYNFSKGGRCKKCYNENRGNIFKKARVKNGNSLGEIYPQTINLWSNKNSETVFDYAKSSSEEVWWRCENNIHDDYKRSIHNSRKVNFRCPECQSFKKAESIVKKKIKNKGSFGDFLIVTFGTLDNIWSKINIISPFDIGKHSSQKIYMICDIHGNYETNPNNYTNGHRCNECAKQQKGFLASQYKIKNGITLGNIYPEVFELWSKHNITSPNNHTPHSDNVVWWKCPNGIHNDFSRNIGNSVLVDFRCPECQFSKGEEKISNYLINIGFVKIEEEDYKKLDDSFKIKYNYYIPQKKYKGLVGLKGGLLSYDFYLPNIQHNLLLEYDGEFHYKPIKLYKNEPIKYAEERLKKQQIHDKLKDEYAKNNNINLLRIPYWDFDNIEEILDNYLEKYKYNSFDIKAI